MRATPSASASGRTTSRPRSLLWMARLNMGESRVRSAWSGSARRSWFLSGGFEPINFPLFHRGLERVLRLSQWASCACHLLCLQRASACVVCSRRPIPVRFSVYHQRHQHPEAESDPGCVKTSLASNPGEWFSQIAQNLPPSEIVIALNCSPKRQLFYQFSTPLHFYTTKTQRRHHHMHAFGRCTSCKHRVSLT
jgi:hypothetical protein